MNAPNLLVEANESFSNQHESICEQSDSNSEAYSLKYWNDSPIAQSHNRPTLKHSIISNLERRCMSRQIVTAAALAIGDELLSGRTRDKNIGHLAHSLTAIGVTLKEVRIVPDEETEIIDAINILRAKFDYVFTSGGIGPTHDDITADSISKAFDLPCIYDDKAMKLLKEHYDMKDLEFTDARQRMARMPEGATHIDNPISKAPGFQIENVYVMAGVPKIFNAMLENILPTLETGQKLFAQSVETSHGEGIIGTALANIQKDFPAVSIGSYPSFHEGGGFTSEIIVRGLDAEIVTAAAQQVANMLKSFD